MEVTAEVTEVDDTGGLQGKIVPGSIIEGNYIYDSDATDYYPNDPEYGRYSFYSSPCGFSLSVEGLVFQTDKSNVSFGIMLFNDYFPDLYDGYVAISYINSMLYDDVKVVSIWQGLYDYKMTALENDELSIDAPCLENWDRKELRLIGGKYDEGGKPIDEFIVTANVTRLVPEPSSMMLIGICFLAIVKNRKTRK